MGTSRLEAFSDGVIAILITIMVLDLKVPPGTTLADLRPLLPTLASYSLSFVFIGIYWNNHHHMLHTCRRVTGTILWANLVLLFSLSLIPFGTSWMGENPAAAAPTSVYGGLLLLSAFAYLGLQTAIIASQGPDSLLKRAVGGDWKGRLSPVLYLTAIPLAFWHPSLSRALYVTVALIWLLPDRRIEQALGKTE